MRSLAALAALVLVAVQAAPNAALSADHKECRKSLVVPGQPSRLRALAQLNAMRDWVRKATSISQRHGFWHNAAQRQIDCETLPNSTMVRCIAKAKPCPGTSPEPDREAKN